jgi:hypothetical protein
MPHADSLAISKPTVIVTMVCYTRVVSLKRIVQAVPVQQSPSAKTGGRNPQNVLSLVSVPRILLVKKRVGVGRTLE